MWAAKSLKLHAFFQRSGAEVFWNIFACCSQCCQRIGCCLGHGRCLVSSSDNEAFKEVQCVSAFRNVQYSNTRKDHRNTGHMHQTSIKFRLVLTATTAKNKRKILNSPSFAPNVKIVDPPSRIHSVPWWEPPGSIWVLVPRLVFDSF